MTSLPISRRCSVALVVSAVSIASCGSEERNAVTPPSFDPTTTVETSTTDATPAEPASASTDATPDSDPDTTPGGDAEVPADVAGGTEGPEAQQPDDDPNLDGGEPSGDASCLVGSWVVGDDELNTWYDILAENSGLGAEIDTVGQVMIDFGESDFTYTGDFDVDIEFNGADGTGSSTGTASGTWSAVDGVIVTDGVESDLAASVVLGDATIDGATIGNGFDTVNPIADAPYSCDGPTLSFQAGPDETFRHTVTLAPA